MNDGGQERVSSSVAVDGVPVSPTPAPRADDQRELTGTVVRLDRVSRWYGDVMALNDVTFTFGAGVTGLLGPNGAGKSTMIRLIVGLSSPGDGVVTIDDKPVRNQLDVLARVGYVPDGDAIYEEISGRRFVTDQALLRGFNGSAARDRADEILDRLGLGGDAASQRVGGYSKGMRQRVKLAAALIHDPDVLVLDEPLTGLDPVMRRDFTRFVHELGDSGVSILVSSHVLHEVEAMTDDVVLIHHGCVVAEGSVTDIRDLLQTQARRIRLLTEQPRALGGRLLQESDLVDGLHIDDSSVEVQTMQPLALCRRVQELAAAGEFPVLAVEPTDEDLHSVFEYLIQ